jgi:hypothetical protein
MFQGYLINTRPLCKFNSAAKNTGIKFSTALALLKMVLHIISPSETMIVHKAVRGAISKQCIEWQNNGNQGIWARKR